MKIKTEQERRKEIIRLKKDMARAFNKFAKSQGYSDFNCYEKMELKE